MVVNTFYITEDDEPIRVDKYLANNLEDITRSRLKMMFDDCLVRVNDKREKCSYIVKPNDVIKIIIPDAIIPNVQEEDLNLKIVYEDDDLVVVDKPKNMVVHPAPGHYTGTLVNGLMYHCKGSLSGINGVLRPGIVHRIDKDTTGLLVVCKNDASHRDIAEQLKVHSITRKYQAICYNNIKEDGGTVNAPIGRHTGDRKKMSISHLNGKEAITHYKVLDRFKNFTHIECRLETGRTHQIRVHMSSINHPILGDPFYGPKDQPFNLEGQTLHAGVLGFVHPTTKEYMEFESPLPEYFVRLLEILKNK